jgi:hypothetical protein
MKPGHGPDFQKGDGPFSLTLTKDGKAAGIIDVEIKTSGPTFEG